MSDSQKFVAKNRGPRVQIEYDVELYGAEKKVQLPFVMGVMSDLSGRAEKPPVDSRAFLDIDSDNFDDRLQAIAPNAQFNVPNTMTGEGNLAVDLTFTKMSDFSPEAIAKNVPALKPLLEARQQLSNLMAYMDGKSGAEALIEKLLADPALLKALADTEARTTDHEAVLETLREVEPNIAEDEDKQQEILDALAQQNIEAPKASLDVDEILKGLEISAIPEVDEAQENLDDILGELAKTAQETVSQQETVDDILGSIPQAKTEPAPTTSVDDILADLDIPAPQTETEPNGEGIDDILGELASNATETLGKAETVDDILGSIPQGDAETVPDASIDDILADLEMPDEPVETSSDNLALDELLAELDPVALDGENHAPQSENPTTGSTQSIEPEPQPDVPLGSPPSSDQGPSTHPFGYVEAAPLVRAEIPRDRFRMAIFGDFSGRAANGKIEVGQALANRRPIPLDVDTIDDVIAGFSSRLALPIGKEGAAIHVDLSELDDLHPDALYENVPMFAELASIKQQLSISSMADVAKERLISWGQTHGQPVELPRKSVATAIPSDLKLSDFQTLIGATSAPPQTPDPIESLLARVVGPHIVKALDATTQSLISAIDECLSGAMRILLHHPDFQAIEAQWRSLDFLARRIETDAKLEIVLFDVSAQELAVDLASSDNLAECGLFSLLEDHANNEGFSAVFGLYQFEETPPHGELLARISQIAAHVDAPFISSISPGYLACPKEDRHPLIARVWDDLADLPSSAYLGLVTPRFLMRQPYGSKSDPIDAFKFEEFDKSEGLSGMLWANPALLAASLMARSFHTHGRGLSLGEIMAEGDIPFHFMTDDHGDQIALPCTERNLTSAPSQDTIARGFMPVVWLRGRNEVRLASWRSVGGQEIAGPWSDAAQTFAKPQQATPVGLSLEADMPLPDPMNQAAEPTPSESEAPNALDDIDDLLAELGSAAPSNDASQPAQEDTLSDLDALLAELDAPTPPAGDGDMDPELAALLDSL